MVGAHVTRSIVLVLYHQGTLKPCCALVGLKAHWCTSLISDVSIFSLLTFQGLLHIIQTTVT